jgi:2-polyprenyl-3-methyl-5-hydroxy-6-metoxy-1,4-benzoquinol methylase
MTIRRVAIIFDNQARPETTGGYCVRALEGLARAQHFLPSQLGRVPRQGFDLYLNVDDGLDYRWPADLRPCAWWAIDTHLNFDFYLARARDFDLVFAAQRDGADRLRQGGIASASWLPLACDPGIHRRHDVPKEWDVCFVGNLFPGPRQELLELIRERFPTTFVGRRYFEDMARTYSASRVVFNRSIRNDINMRVFEALACGSLLVTNDLRENGQEELFLAGEHLVTYAGAEDLLDRIAFYLRHEESRERIAAAGREVALARHTYRHRMETLLAEAGRALRRTTGGPPEEARAVAPQEGPPPTPGEGQLEPPAPAALAEASTNGTAGGPQDPGYFNFPRPEILALIPRSARQVLDVGCGAGRLGEALKARQPAEVVGIELDGAAAGAARARLDEVFVGDAERLDLPFAPGSFDAVVCGDVLEHLREPARLLRRARGWLRPGGLVVASIPNVRHHSVVAGLLDGNWTYEPAGLLDRTHLRFFTRRTAEQLFRDAGFTVTGLGVVPGPGYEEWERRGRPGKVEAGGLHVRGITPEEAEEFFAYQYLVTATPSREETSGPAADVSPGAEESPDRAAALGSPQPPAAQTGPA